MLPDCDKKNKNKNKSIKIIDLSLSLTEGMVGCEPNELAGDTAGGNEGEEEGVVEISFFLPFKTRDFLCFK